MSDHPYVGVTNAEGEVKFDSVPAGDYEVVFWKANWHVAAMERDPELIRHVRLAYYASAEKHLKCQIIPGQDHRLELAFLANDFVSQRK